MVRAPCCEKMGLKKGPWTPEEDQILVSYIQKNGHGNWRALPKQAGLLRCGKSCRLRWTNYLRPDIKRGNFSKEEEESIIQLHEMLGNRWSAIAARLPGRTDNEIKNVWHTHLKKRLNSNYQCSQETTKKQSKSTVKKSDTVKTNFTAKQEVISLDGPSGPVSPPHSSSDLSSVTADSTAAASGIPIKQEMMDVQECLTQVDERYLSEELRGDGATLFAENTGNMVKEEVDFRFPLFSLDSNEEGVNANMSKLDDDMEFWYSLLIRAEDLPDLPEI